MSYSYRQMFDHRKVGVVRSHSWSIDGWYLTELKDTVKFTLTHYDTELLRWQEIADAPNANKILISAYYGIGSVSDQTGLNRAFRILGFPYTYSRNRKTGGFYRIGEWDHRIDRWAI